ncbi:MAG: hypothetical protein HY051_00825 [Candidatus Aenigmarchaeota archaeon]|nr:hypothetical protein [Candidatus Aenigmarchaeota archaeon]
MKNLKGINPLIASVLLIGFTMAVAAVLVLWITGFTQQQTESIGQRGEQQTLCAYSTLLVDRDDVSVLGNSTAGDGSRFNVTITYSTGTEILNITGIMVRDANGVTYTNTTVPNIDATVRNLGVGSSVKLNNYILSGVMPLGVAWREIRVTALCQSRYTVVGTVNSL